LIRVEGLSKSFRVHKKEPGLKGSLKAVVRRKWVDKHALKEVSLKVDEGEIVGLVGANGAGKTTLVKVCAGIIHPSEGQVRVLGYDPFARVTAFRKQIALIMGQKAQLWWDLPAADCFLLLREIYRIPKAQYDRTLDFLATTLGVTAHLTTQIRRLSLGERMKMEVIAALLHEPRVVFLDEPTIGLDLTAQKAVRKFILDYRRNHRPAMLLTSHYMEDIEQLCERLVILRHGRIIYDGSLRAVVDKYAKYKRLAMRLKPDSTFAPKIGADLADALPALKRDLASVVEIEDERLIVRIRRDRAADAAAAVLSSLPVVDLTIEEEDIGAVIEALQRDGLVAAEGESSGEEPASDEATP
jgi:ABC-2 type transport system ATP-binding protein